MKIFHADKLSIMFILRASILSSLFLFFNTTAHANDSCGLRAVKLFAAGDWQPLTALFANDKEVLDRLKVLAGRAGAIKDLEVVSHPRFPKFGRVTAQSIATPAGFNYAGQWVNATSDKLGPVQFHVAADNKEGCTLLALHLDYAIK